jgi:hypothetical protein
MEWFHVPKCGSTLINSLIQLPGICPGIPEAEHVEEGGDLTIFHTTYQMEDACPGAFNEEGHLCLGDHSGVGSLYGTVVEGHAFTLFRQPEQRIMSGFSDSYHSWPYWYYERWPLDVREYATPVSGCAVKMLTRDGLSFAKGHNDTVCGDPVPPTPAEVSAAQVRLREGFVFVGLAEQWELSICLLHRIIGGPCRYYDLYTSEFGPGDSATTYDLSELQGYRDIYDGALYATAVEVFNENLQRYNVSLSTCEPCLEQALKSKP